MNLDGENMGKKVSKVNLILALCCFFFTSLISPLELSMNNIVAFMAKYAMEW